MPERQKTVQKLITLLGSNRDLKYALEISLENAARTGTKTLDEFYNFLDRILKHIPTEKELMPTVREFYFVLSKSPGDILKKDQAFNDWINEFVKSRGNFLDTTASTETLETFIRCPDYHIEDYIKGPSGWLTYNQFLARQIKPGKRPVADRCNDNVIVSPADSEYKGQWPIKNDSTVSVKGSAYRVTDLLGDSRYRDKFKNGIFTHSFLSIADYHRYHTPVGGLVHEVKNIPANTWVTEAEKPDGSLENTDDVGFQFEHTRGHIIIESIAGFVAVMPVGMGHISSVNITVEEGTTLVKGEEFGFFGFGGSDIIMLFEAGKVEVTAKEKEHYKQGEQIGSSAHNNNNIS